MFAAAAASSRLFILGSLAVGLIAGTIAIGCSDAPVEGSSENQVRDRPNAGQTKNDSEGSPTAPAAADAGAAGKETSSSSSSSGGTKEKGDAASPPSRSTPQCLAECESSGLRAKCAQEGEDDFCDFACDTLTAQQRTCLNATANCSKEEWIACTPQQGGGDGKKK